MKKRKPPANPKNTFRERGLISQLLDSYADDHQKRTGADYLTAWHEQADTLARQNGFEAANPEELRNWIFSQPLGNLTQLKIAEPFNTSPPEANEIIHRNNMVCSPEDAFSNLDNLPRWDMIAAYLSVFAQNAYLKEDAVRLFTQEQGAHSFCWFSHPPTDNAAFGCVLYGHPILFFKGTQTVRQWIIDALILPWGRPIRHMGFHLSWSVLKDQVTNWLNSLSLDKGLILTGHSLGGAMAFLAAYDLYPRGIDAVITFGAPRPAMAGFKKDYGSRCCTTAQGPKPLSYVTHRYTHETDIVSRIPPPLLFCHVTDTEKFVHDDGSVEIKFPPNYIQRIERISSKTLELPHRLFGDASLPRLSHGFKDTTEAMLTLLKSLYRSFSFTLWGVYFFSCFLLLLLIPLACIDSCRHFKEGYVKAFAERFSFEKTP